MNVHLELKNVTNKSSKIVEYTIAPIFMNQSSGAHEWAIEFEKPPNGFVLVSTFHSVLTLQQNY